MKKLICALLVASLAFFALVFSLSGLSSSNEKQFQVAMITDFADVNDASFNQATYEGAKEWCSDNNIKFNYYKPSDISLAERIKSMNLAIDRGYNVIICHGFAFGEALPLVAPKHPDIKFIGIDISEDDFPDDFVLTDNIAIFNYHEEIAGYLAGYAVTKEGFTNLGFVGGLAASAVIRYGYGYVQGCDAAAREIKKNIELQYVYAGQFFGDGDVFKYVDNWYKVNNTQIIFSCGGSIYTSIALSAKENNRYIIGVDTNQAPIIDHDYKEGICITSAMKGIKQTVINKLGSLYYNGEWDQGINYLGLVSYEDPSVNYVQLPVDDWRMNNFTIDDYKQLIKEIMLGERQISTNVVEPPQTSQYSNVIYRGSIK